MDVYITRLQICIICLHSLLLSFKNNYLYDAMNIESLDSILLLRVSGYLYRSSLTFPPAMLWNKEASVGMRHPFNERVLERWKLIPGHLHSLARVILED